MLRPIRSRVWACGVSGPVRKQGLSPLAINRVGKSSTSNGYKIWAWSSTSTHKNRAFGHCVVMAPCTASKRARYSAHTPHHWAHKHTTNNSGDCWSATRPSVTKTNSQITTGLQGVAFQRHVAHTAGHFFQRHVVHTVDAQGDHHATQSSFRAHTAPAPNRRAAGPVETMWGCPRATNAPTPQPVFPCRSRPRYFARRFRQCRPSAPHGPPRRRQPTHVDHFWTVHLRRQPRSNTNAPLLHAHGSWRQPSQRQIHGGLDNRSSPRADLHLVGHGNGSRPILVTPSHPSAGMRPDVLRCTPIGCGVLPPLRDRARGRGIHPPAPFP